MIEVCSLTKIFRVGKKQLLAVNNVSFQIPEGEIVGLVGESGCGKSTLAKMLTRLEKPTSGNILFEGEELSPKDRSICRNLQMIFQDPFSSLNPRMTVETLIEEPLIVHGLQVKGVAGDLLELVGLHQSALRKFPHEFSGGQRQRIAIARAIALKPKFLICDEPLSSLDLTTAMQVATLLHKLQKELKLTYLFITHDLSMVRLLSNQIMVMYFGSIVETAGVKTLFSNPLHPYTQLLLASVPLPDPILERKRVRVPILGDPPSPFHPPTGCPFAGRCPKAQAICREKKPELREMGTGHKVACHFA